MAWTTPKTWTTGELVTAADLNTHLRDNLTALKDPPTAIATVPASGNTTSTTFVPINGTSLSLDVTTAGGRLMVVVLGTFYTYPGDTDASFDIAIDNTRVGGASGLLTRTNDGTFAMCYLTSALSAASHNIKPQFKSASGSVPVYATVEFFWVREVS